MPPEPEKEIKASLKGSRLHALTCYPEWKEFLSLVDEYLDVNLQKLISGEDPEARGAILLIRDMMAKMGDDIRFGDICRQKVTEFYKPKVSGAIY